MEIKEKHCKGCNKTKLITDFVRDKHCKSGYTAKCKLCRIIKQKEWVLKNPEKVKALNIKHRSTRKAYYSDPERKLIYRKKYIEKTFNIDYSIYEKMLEEQKNVCYICNNVEISTRNNYLAVDHNHETGKIRGLLCTSCNRGLGFFKDNEILLQNAVNYLKLKN